MSINIIYTIHYNKNTVADGQLDLLKEYFKHIYEDEELRFTEYWSFSMIENRVVQWGGYYYVSKNETLSEAIAATQGKGKNWTFYYNKTENAHRDTLWDYQVIYKGVLESEGKIAFDAQRREIASCTFKKESNSYSSKTKMFYGDPDIFRPPYEDAAAFTFYYHENSTAPYDIVCQFRGDVDNDYSLSDFLARKDIMAIFPWNQHTYYRNFEPMLP